MGGHVKLLLLTAIICGFHSLSQANEITASIVTKQNNELVMVSESNLEFSLGNNWGLNQVPFNSIKNLQIKGTFMGTDRAILVFDIEDTVTNTLSVQPQTHVLTTDEKLVPAELDSTTGHVRVVVSESGQVLTTLGVPVGEIAQLNASILSKGLLWSATGRILTHDGQKVGSIVSIVTDLNKKIATLSGSGSEVVITGEKKEFLASVDELQNLNAQQKQNPEWVPVTDLKISNLSSVLQIEFRNSTEEESFTVFKLVSPLVVSQIKENQTKP